MSADVDFFYNIQQTLALYNIDEKTLESLKSFSNEAQTLIPQFLDSVEEWITRSHIFQVVYKNEKSLRQFHEKKKKYWEDFFGAVIDKEYIKTRFEMGNYYSHINLSLNAYCALINYKIIWWTHAVDRTQRSPQEKKEISDAITKLILLDSGATCIAYTETNNRLIEQQSTTLMQLSTPTIQLWEGILLLPIIGVLDSIRAQNMMEELLNRIVQTSSTVSIIDIGGVPNVDSSVANHLIKIVRATKLLGNTCILSGISPEIAQTLVEVGVDLDGIITTSTLHNSLKLGLDLINLSIKIKETNI